MKQNIRNKEARGTASLMRICTVLLLSGMAIMSSCKKYLEVDLNNSLVTTDVVFSDDNTATSAMSGVYYNMILSTSFSGGDYRSIVALSGQSADELFNFPRTTGLFEFDENSLRPDNVNVLLLWQTMYKTIYECNSMLKGLSNSTGVSVDLKKQLEGEAHFVRAFCYFYLVNLFGDVPLITTTDYEANSITPRASKDLVYNKIVEDLIFAQQNIKTTYITTERVRPNSSTATALLARVYLYKGQWAEAEAQATAVINNPTYGLVSTLDSVFLKNNREAIWQLMPPANTNTFEARMFVITATPARNILRTGLVNAFEVGDTRKTKWVNSILISTPAPPTTYYFPFKYKVYQSGQPVTEYSMVFRLAEQFLIRAEARAQQGNLVGVNSAATDINRIRNRVTLSNTNATTLPQIMAAIEQERRLELFAEWGHRWLDLKRWNRANAVISLLKPTWNAEDVLYPIPQSEFDKNPNLGSQNPGY